MGWALQYQRIAGRNLYAGRGERENGRADNNGDGRAEGNGQGGLQLQRKVISTERRRRDEYRTGGVGGSDAAYGAVQLHAGVCCESTAAVVPGVCAVSAENRAGGGVVARGVSAISSDWHYSAPVLAVSAAHSGALPDLRGPGID